MDRAYKFVIGVILALHVFLTPVLVQMAYNDRGGQMAFGGEYLALPLIATLLLLIMAGLKTLKTKSK